MIAFYKSFDEVRHRNFDGLIITGAPVENLPFEAVDYWPELCEIMEWSKTHVHSTLHICWGAQAGLYYHYGIPKIPLPQKLFGVFLHTVEDPNFILFRGFDDQFWGRQIFIMGHSEYDRDTLKREYLRDVAAGVPIQLPRHYFPGDNPSQPPVVNWRSCANLLYSNWLNYFVYQTTPYDLNTL